MELEVEEDADVGSTDPRGRVASGVHRLRAITAEDLEPNLDRGHHRGNRLGPGRQGVQGWRVHGDGDRSGTTR